MRPGQRAVAMIATLAIAAAAVVAAPSVFADPGKSIAEVEAEIAQLETEAEMANEQLSGARIRLERVRDKQARTKEQARKAQASLDQQARDLGEMASVAYRSGGMDASVQLLFADNAADFLQQSAALDIVAKSRNAVLRRSTAARLQLAQANVTLGQQEQEAAAIEAEMAQYKQDIDASLAQQQQVLKQLKEEERKRLEAERRARAAAAAAAAAAAQAAAEQAARDAEARAAAAAANNDTAQSGGGTNDTPTADTGGPGDSGGSNSGGGSSSGGDSGGSGGQDSGFVGSDQAAIAVAAALAQVGEPYTYDAHPPDTWDCSKLTAWAWGQAGVSLTPYSYDQANEVRRISTDELRPGDLLFYFNGAHHVSMYIGGGQIVEAASPSSGVRVTDVWNGWNSSHFSFAGRPVG